MMHECGSRSHRLRNCRRRVGNGVAIGHAVVGESVVSQGQEVPVAGDEERDQERPPPVPPSVDTAWSLAEFAAEVSKQSGRHVPPILQGTAFVLPQ
jgi:hypothetical protein